MKEATIARIADEALKPTSAVIDALLGARLKRIRAWAEKRELKTRLERSAINDHLDSYLKRSLRRICGITTLVFPQQTLPLTTIYEPLQLIGKFSPQTTENTTLSTESIKPGGSYFIVDTAGMGKSTFVKHLFLQILNSTNKIPIFLELRRISEDESLLGKLAAEIDSAQKDVDEELLQMLLDEGNFILILDGYDELSDQVRQKISPQITDLAIRCDQNSVILTARPEVALPELPNSLTFTIEPLTPAQAQSLVLRYDAVANIDVGKRLIGHFADVSEEFIKTPLLVMLLYRTYGFNQSIATRISSFYDEVFTALYKGHDLSKAGFARKKKSGLDADDFRRLLRGFAFLLAVTQKENLKSKTEGIAIIKDAAKLTAIDPQTAAFFFDDLLLAVPLLVKEGTDFRFIHRSIGEFFAAEFLAFQSNSEQIIGRINASKRLYSFTGIFEYLSEINPSLFRQLIVAPLARKVLEDETPGFDPIIRSICFLGQAALGLWPRARYCTSGVEPGKRIVVRSPFSAASYFYGSDYEEECFLSISHDWKNVLCPTAWTALSEEIDYFGDEHDDHTFDGLGAVLPEQWTLVDDPSISKILAHPSIQASLMSALHGLQRGKRSQNKRDNQTRVLSIDACKKVLQETEEERKVQDWLGALFDTPKSVRTE